jgi:hypothetical protein
MLLQSLAARPKLPRCSFLLLQLQLQLPLLLLEHQPLLRSS